MDYDRESSLCCRVLEGTVSSRPRSLFARLSIIKYEAFGR